MNLVFLALMKNLLNVNDLIFECVSPEERLAGFAGHSVKVTAQRFVAAHSTHFVVLHVHFLFTRSYGFL